MFFMFFLNLKINVFNICGFSRDYLRFFSVVYNCIVSQLNVTLTCTLPQIIFIWTSFQSRSIELCSLLFCLYDVPFAILLSC